MNTFQLNPEDKQWVDDNFAAFIQIFGLPAKDSSPVIINADFFPHVIADKKIRLPQLIEDLSQLFQLNAKHIRFAYIEDLKRKEVPKAIRKRNYETHVVQEEDSFTLFISRNLLQEPRRLIFLLMYEFLQIKMLGSALIFEVMDDIGPFMCIAGVYFGLGVLISRNVYSYGKPNYEYWDSKWMSPGAAADEIMAYALALYTQLKEEKDPDWIKLLPSDFSIDYQFALRFLNDSDTDLTARADIKFSLEFQKASDFSQEKKYDKAIEAMQSLIDLAPDEINLSIVYNNLGYYQSLNGNYEASIPCYEKALELNPDFSYAYDNMGYAYIRMGFPDKGRACIKEALLSNENDVAYSFRNLALYHLAKGEIEEARGYFELSYENISQPVDLLDFHYAEFLLEVGEREKGMEYLQRSVNKGEPVAIRKMQSLRGLI
ncbi:MAG: tetratricopeptide repeat protein [Bacteroidia bacterium]|nr:tetratricopeptide repeat protein [Bacteroidia bacterium]